MAEPARKQDDEIQRPEGETGDGPVIEVHKLVTHYGQRKILSDVDLQVKQGEVLVIMGGSGAA